MRQAVFRQPLFAKVSKIASLHSGPFTLFDHCFFQNTAKTWISDGFWHPNKILRVESISEDEIESISEADIESKLRAQSNLRGGVHSPAVFMPNNELFQ